MNLVGHIEVAERCGLDRAGVFGAILPDVASMLRVRIDRAALPPAVADGVRIHHATDAAFHGHASVRAAMGAIGASLTARGIARGAGRAAAHVGYEMLLDAAVDDRLGEVMAGADQALVSDVLTGDVRRWIELRDHFADRRAHHDDPRWVTERLYGVLRHRPRLALPLEQVPAVAAALAEHAPVVRRDAPVIFDAVTAAARAAVVVGSAWQSSALRR